MTVTVHQLSDGTSGYVPLMDVSGLVAVLYLLAVRGLFDRCNVELGHDAYGEYPSTYARRLPRWLRMPFNTAVNVLYLLCGWYWLRKAGCEEETRAETKALRGPLLMPAEAAYWFRAYGWLCVHRGIVQALFMVAQNRRLASLCELSRLLIVSWCVLWSLRLLGFLGEGTSRFVAALAVPVVHFVCCLRDPRGHERAEIHQGLLMVLLMAFLQFRYGDVAHSLTSLVLGCACAALLAVLARNDMELARSGPPLFRSLTGFFWSRVCEALVLHCAARFMFAVSVNKYVDSSLQYDFPGTPTVAGGGAT
ncbi:transmembrane protein, putative [Ixodes scapularis]|uniref:Transmembrane protein, putative n=1 Tax=Ixodes scapularis TaxID=6945 RepID=B7PMC6_IXOSC|nr:transmembrane protein, putative [Ixodes scapularis]|eukprot:XP_002434924.1 transmembrane protein, putative [Ixodes scapularis]